jgi:hypothetical protein
MQRVHGFLSLIVVLLLGTVSAGQPGVSKGAKGAETPSYQKPQNWALLVGVNAYIDIRPLKYCVADMEALRNKLVDSGFTSEDIFLLSDEADIKYKPTKNNIVRQLELLVQVTERQDTLVVAFSGHGVQLLKDPKDPQSGYVSYFCPVDANLTRPADTLVPLDEIYKMIDKCEAKVKVLLVDACRNDPFKPGDKGAEDAAKSAGLKGLSFDDQALPEGILLLNSCKAGQQSWEDADLGHGVFMHYLLKGLEGEADSNKDGEVGVLELYQFAQPQTKRHVLRVHNAAQVPSIKGELASDPMIAMVPKRVSRPLDVARTTPASASTPTPLPAAVPEPVNTSTNPAVQSLLNQGNNYYAKGEYDNAIAAYRTALELDKGNALIYARRAAAYKAKGEIKLAVIDCQAANQPLTLTVTEASAPLRDGEAVIATAKQGQSLQVNKIQFMGDNAWLWVASADGNDAAHGWILMSAVETKPATPPAAAPAAQPAATPPANTAPANTNNGYYNNDYYNNGYYNNGGSYDSDERMTPAERAAENKLDSLYNRYDRNPTPALERQIDVQERRMERMGGGRGDW